MNLMESLMAQRLAGRSSGGGSDLTPEVKEALLDCFANVAWATEDGQQYYDALADALYGLQSISAVYTQSGTVYDTDSLDSLKADLVVTATYGDGSTQTVPAESYTLSGTLTEGTSTITVSYGGKTTTFDVVVDARLVWEWTPDKGMDGITMVASTGETPNYQLLSDAMRLYGPNDSAVKWTGIALTDYLGLTDATVEVYYKNLYRNADSAIGVMACTHGIGASSGYLGYATYYANRSDSEPVSTLLRGSSTTKIDRASPLINSGVVKCHINMDTPILNASYPGGYTLTDTPNQSSVAITPLRVASVEAGKQNVYADITRIAVMKGDTT